jgi:O-antigen ligase
MNNILLYLPVFGIYSAFLVGVNTVEKAGFSGGFKYVVMFCFFAAYSIAKSGKLYVRKNFTRPLGAFLIIGFFSVTWSIRPDISMLRSLFNLLAILLVCFIIFKSTKTHVELIVNRAFGLIAFTTIAFLGADYIGFNSEASYFQGNYHGMFYNSNFLGQTIALICLPYVLIGTTKGGLKSLVYVACTVLFLYFLLQTRSRAAIISFIVEALVMSFWYLSSKKGWYKAITYFLVTVCMFAFITQLTFFADKYDTGSGKTSEAFVTRSSLWFAHIDKILERPLFGWGLGVNPVNFKDNLELGDSEKGNSIIALVEEIGFLPVAFLALLSFPLMRLFIRKIYLGIKSNSIDNAGILCFVFICGSIIHSNFESWLFYFGNPFTYLMLLCLSLITARDSLDKA